MKQELQERDRTLVDEITRLRSEMNDLRGAPAESAEPLPEGLDLGFLEKAVTKLPAVQQLVKQNQELRQQVQANAIDGSLDLLREEPFHDEIRRDLERDLKLMATQPNAPAFTREGVTGLFKQRSYDRMKDALGSLRQQAEKVEDEHRKAMEQANLSSGSEAEGGESPDMGQLADDDYREVKEAITPEMEAKFLRTKSGGQ